MTEKEAKVFLNNLKVCIEEHPIVADWLVEIADRDNPLNKVKGSERSLKGLEQDPLHDDCFDCDKFFTCDNKGDDYKTDCAWKKGE